MTPEGREDMTPEENAELCISAKRIIAAWPDWRDRMEELEVVDKPFRAQACEALELYVQYTGEWARCHTPTAQKFMYKAFFDYNANGNNIPNTWSEEHIRHIASYFPGMQWVKQVTDLGHTEEEEDDD